MQREIGGAISRMTGQLKFYEFFAGGGMARVGLEPAWNCTFANDNSTIKALAYAARWGEGHLDTRSIDEVAATDIPRGAHMAWASFPCQDVSVAGNGLGIGTAAERETRSSALWPFLDLMAALRDEDEHPAVIALENVTGLLTSNGGQDFATICDALANLDYVFGAVLVDAKFFVPQSRPRVFLIAAREDRKLPAGLLSTEAVRPWHNSGIENVHAALPPHLSRRWRWWDLGVAPELADDALVHAIDLTAAAAWNSTAETDRLLDMMPDTHKARLEEAKAVGRPVIGSLYLRMRPREHGNVQCAEISFAPTLGCLRTPRGGGSRPRIIVVEGESVRTRLLSAREAARLMGLPETYPLPDKYQHAFQLMGDGVVAPVVRFLGQMLIEPLARAPIGLPPPDTAPEPAAIEEQLV